MATPRHDLLWLLPTFDDPLSAVPEWQHGLLPGDDDLAMMGNGKAHPRAPTCKTGEKTIIESRQEPTSFTHIVCFGGRIVMEYQLHYERLP